MSLLDFRLRVTHVKLHRVLGKVLRLGLFSLRFRVDNFTNLPITKWTRENSNTGKIMSVFAVDKVQIKYLGTAATKKLESNILAECASKIVAS